MGTRSTTIILDDDKVKEKMYTEGQMLEKCISFGEHIQKQLSEVSGQSFNFNLIGELKGWFEQNVK